MTFKEQIMYQLQRTLRVLSGFPSVQAFFSEIASLWEFAGAYQRNQYRDVSPATIFFAAAGLIYLISPIDLMPDFIPIVGLLDDLAVLRVIVELIRSDLSKFQTWQSWMESMAKGNSSPVE